MDQLSVYAAPQTAAALPLQTVQAVPAVPMIQPLQQYLITDASGHQTIVTGTAQTFGTPVHSQYGLAVSVMPAAAPTAPLFPRWTVRLSVGVALGGVALGGVAIGLELLATALDHIAEAIAELVRVLVPIVVVVAGLVVAAKASKAMKGGTDSKSGSTHIDNSITNVTTNVTTNIRKARFKTVIK